MWEFIEPLKIVYIYMHNTIKIFKIKGEHSNTSMQQEVISIPLSVSSRQRS